MLCVVSGPRETHGGEVAGEVGKLMLAAPHPSVNWGADSRRLREKELLEKHNSAGAPEGCAFTTRYLLTQKVCH